jgi:hypothetical protein
MSVGRHHLDLLYNTPYLSPTITVEDLRKEVKRLEEEVERISLSKRKKELEDILRSMNTPYTPPDYHTGDFPTSGALGTTPAQVAEKYYKHPSSKIDTSSSG